MLTRKRIDEIAKVLSNTKNCVSSKIKEEDIEEVNLNQNETSTPNSASTLPLNSTNSDDEEEQQDPLVDQVIKLVQQYKDKQVSDAQQEYAYRQNQANKIVDDIEKFIKDNTKK